MNDAVIPMTTDDPLVLYFCVCVCVVRPLSKWQTGCKKDAALIKEQNEFVLR